jgi:hypothetical protein
MQCRLELGLQFTRFAFVKNWLSGSDGLDLRSGLDLGLSSLGNDELLPKFWPRNSGDRPETH